MKFFKIPLLSISLALLLANTACSQKVELIKKHRSPYAIIEQAQTSEWRDVNPEQLLYIELITGKVIVELAPDYAPLHVDNTKKLVRDGVFDNTSFYRVIDGFVAQGGPIADDDTAIQPPKHGSLTLKAEFTKSTEKPMSLTLLNAKDDYADEVGFYKGFAVGRTADKKINWLLHCYGAFAMGRANDINSGGTELYIVIGAAQRYLDRNTTVFGRVISGMAHIQALKRSQDLMGNNEVTKDNVILSIKVAADLPPKEQIPLQVMRTNSDSFKALIKSRKNRMNPWFVYQHDYIDACSVPIPVRINKK